MTPMDLRAGRWQRAVGRGWQRAVGGARAWDGVGPVLCGGVWKEGGARPVRRAREAGRGSAPSHHPVEPLPEEDALEVLHREGNRRALVQPLVLGKLLPPVKLGLPLGVVARPPLALRPPVRHRQARPRQPRDAANDDHAKHGAAAHEQPPPDGAVHGLGRRAVQAIRSPAIALTCAC